MAINLRRFRAPAWLWALVLLIGAVLAWQVFFKGEKKVDPYRALKIDRGEIQRVVAATGGLEPIVTVSVGSTVSGPVRDVLVDFNAPVRAGQLLARIDPTTFEARVKQLTADVDAQRSTLAVQEANLLQAQAEVAQAEADLIRAEKLKERDFASDQLVLQRRTAAERARASISVAKSQIQAQRARIRQAEAQLASAKIDLDRTYIKSPIDGVVVDRQVDPGQSVAASFQAPTLFKIAQDLSRLEANIAVDEADIGEVRDGLPVEFTVDAFPGQKFNGEVAQVRKQGQQNQGVVSYVVVVQADNPGGRLLPGMTANAEIITDKRDSVLRLPNAALRFRPGDPKVADLAKALPEPKPDPAPGPPASPGPGSGPGSGAPAGGDGPKSGPRSGQAGANQVGNQGANQSGGGQSGGRGAQMVDRLAQQLELTPQQKIEAQKRIEDVRANLGPFPGQDAPQEERRAYFRKMREKMLKAVEPILDERQKGLLAEMRNSREGAARTINAVVWVLRGEKPVPVRVKLGSGDDSYTEILGPELKEGDQVIVGGGPKSKKSQSPNQGPSGPQVRIRGA